MKTTKRFGFVFVLILALLTVLGGLVSTSDLANAQSLDQADEIGPQANVGTGFTYQGRLLDGGSPANGSYDFQFKLFDAPTGGAQLMTDVIKKEDVVVTDGRFSVVLDFGGVFDGTAFWLQIEVRPGSENGAYTVLNPRQPLTAAPYALGLRPGATINGVVDGDISGVLNVKNTGTGDGLRVDSGRHGVIVGSADANGLHVGSAGSDGLFVGSAGGNGVEIGHAAGDGIFVCATGSETNCTASDLNNGLELGSVENHGVYVESAGFSGVWVDSASDGVHVNSATNDGIAVDSADENGLFIDSAGGDGVTVLFADGDGVSARTTSSASYGGRFFNAAASGSGAGLYTRGNVGSAPDIVLGANGSGTVADDGRIISDPDFDGSDIRFFTNDNLWIDLDESDSHSGSNVTIRNSNDDTVWSVDENGNMTASGSKSALVKAGPFGRVKLYALESPENWFEDFGSGSLVNGETTIRIEPKFAATVNLSQPYHVFLTPLGDCALYVAEKSATSFRVRALDGATCSIDFDYRLVAKRTGYEDLRLEPADLQTNKE